MKKRIGQYVFIDMCKNLLIGMYDIDVYVGFIFVVGEDDFQKWIDDLVEFVIINGIFIRI